MTLARLGCTHLIAVSDVDCGRMIPETPVPAHVRQPPGCTCGGRVVRQPGAVLVVHHHSCRCCEQDTARAALRGRRKGVWRRKGWRKRR